MGKLSVKNFISESGKQKIATAISNAEKNTTGEIRIRIDKKCTEANAIDAAITIFYQLNMNNTQHQNGVLIYIAVEDKSYCIIGDKAIDHIVHKKFWDKIATEMHDFFVRQQFEDGIVHAINKVGEVLHQHFPIKDSSTNENELTDDISFG